MFKIRAKSVIKAVTPSGNSLDLTMPKGAKLDKLFKLATYWMLTNIGETELRAMFEEELKKSRD